MDYSNYGTRNRNQRERTPGRDEVQNSAGGFVHQIDDWDRLDRFLILGTEGGTYYVGERELTTDNVDFIVDLIKSEGVRVVRRVVEISTAGRSHKNDACLFVLAAALKMGNEQTRKLASGVMPEVARTGTHLFTFAKFVEAFGGWGRLTKRTFQRWYNSKNPNRLAYQLLKYRQRDGWSHRDILRLAHPIASNNKVADIFDVTAHPEKLESMLTKLPELYTGYEKAQRLAANPDPAIIEQYGLSWEMLPTEWMNDERVNKQLLVKMPLMATMRQLGKLTANGTLKPLSPETAMVVERLTDDEAIHNARVHPMHYLLAHKTYESGQGFRGNLSWKVDAKIKHALDDGFYKAFHNVEPTGKAFLVGVDVSGSMGWSNMAGSNMTPAEAAAAMAMVIARTEVNTYIHGFAGEFVDLGISDRDTLADALRKTRNRNFGRTDCALPMVHALKNGINVDTFVVITDNETWAGSVKPVDALRTYREKVNPKAKLVVIGMTATRFSIADPNDAGMLDIVGFDANVPQLLAEFSR